MEAKGKMDVRVKFPAGIAALLGLCLSACQSDSTGPKTEPQPGQGAARFGELLVNPKWYRTLDSTSSLDPYGGDYIFSWTFLDSARHPDSFYVGIDTLWMLPQNMEGDTANDWDLMVCPGGQCAGGVHSGFFGVNYAEHFGSNPLTNDTDFALEHHFQFYPSLSKVSFLGTGPANPEDGIFGGMLFVRSRSGSSPTDTVFGFAAWKMQWDTAYPPPVRPTGGRLPRRADFKIVNGKVRYQPD
jgi:hypothetical protein